MTKESKPTDNIIEVTSGYGANTAQPFVQLLNHRADFMAQMSPDAARELAMNLLTAADAAESDGFIVGFLKETIGIEEADKWAHVLLEFRDYRERQRINEQKKRRRELYPEHLPGFINP